MALRMDVRHLLEQAKNLEKALADLDGKLRAHQSDGSAGNGAVKVTVNGAGDVVALVLDPELVAKGGDLLSQTILTALRQATEASRRYREEQRAALTGGLKLPEL